MSETKIVRLVEANPRDVWPYEATDFTPWLADNLDFLSEALGFELELVGREVSVEAFSADILAVDPQTGARVLIENQLERSDHSHLGQILTYLAGLDAQTIIWIAPRFTTAHLSAIGWLNANTGDDIGFFAIELRAVKVAEDTYAPILEVVKRPDTWVREVNARVAGAEAERTALRGQFWGLYLDRHPGAVPRCKHSNNWVPLLPDGSAQLSIYISLNSAGMFVRGGHGADTSIIANIVTPHREDLEQRLGVPLDYNPEKGAYLWDKTDISLNDKDRWPDAVDWLEKRRRDYLAAFGAL